MLFAFYLFGSILSFSKDNIKRFLNTTVGLCVVHPDNSPYDFNQNNVLETLLSLVEGRFSFSSMPYSQYSLSDKSLLSSHSNNIIITREDKFLELYVGNLSLISVSEEINSAFYSYIEVLNESSISEFKEDTIPLFLLTGPSIIKEYEDAAFFYKATKSRFGYIYQNSTDNESFASLSFIDNKNNVTRMYDRSIPIIQFIRSCKTQKSKKNKFEKNQNNLRFPKHYSQFIAISDNFTDEIKSAFDYLNSTNYGEYIAFEVVPWDKASDIMKECQIQKTESNLTYVMLSKMKKRQYNDCYVFQDMDFYSKELLYFFVSKAFKSRATESSEPKSFFNKFLMNSFPQKLTQSSFASIIPGRNLALVFIECPNSFSFFDAKVIYNTLLHEFNEKKYITKLSQYYPSDQNNNYNNINNNDSSNSTNTNTTNADNKTMEKYLRPVDFYKIEYNIDNFRLPSADGFPSFAIYEPFNKQAHVFKDVMTIENVRNWILKFATEVEEREDVNPLIQETNNIINDFTTFIKDLSIGNNGKHEDESNDKTGSNTEGQKQNTANDKTNSNDNEPVEQTIEIQGDSNLKNFLNSIGLNLNLDDFHEIKIVTDFDTSVIGNNNEIEDKKTEDVTKEDNDATNESNDELKDMIEKSVKIEVKNLFNQERDQFKKEIINEILENIKNDTDFIQRVKLLNLDKRTNDSKQDLQQNAENKDIKNKTRNKPTDPPQNNENKSNVKINTNEKNQTKQAKNNNIPSKTEKIKPQDKDIKSNNSQEMKNNEIKKETKNDEILQRNEVKKETSNDSPKVDDSNEIKKKETANNSHEKSKGKESKKLPKENEERKLPHRNSDGSAQIFDMYQETEEEL